MKVALIPPVPDLCSYATTDIHLLLSHLFSVPGYVEYYRTRSEDYIILDNSAHEQGVGNSAIDLLEQARLVGADEVVCPDVLFDWKGTVEMTTKMLVYISKAEGWERYVSAGMPRLMLVPQGTTRGEWAKCLGLLMHYWDKYMGSLAGAPPVIGVSKDYEPLVSGGLAALVSKYLTPLHKSNQVDAHCLGWPRDLWALAKVHDKAPWVRSTDSAKPFVYARAGVRLEPGGDVPPYPARQEDYHTAAMLPKHHAFAHVNVEVFKAAATAELILA